MVTIAFDMDNVLCNWEQGFIDAWMKDPVQKLKPYIKIEDRNTFYASDQYTDLKDQVFAKKAPRQPGFYENLLPMDGAVNGMREIIKLPNVEIIILTSPMSNHPTCAQEKLSWIKTHFGRYLVDKVIIAKDKTRIKANFLIDDKPIITGSEKPEWEHIMFDMPYNRQMPNKRMTWVNCSSLLNKLLFS